MFSVSALSETERELNYKDGFKFESHEQVKHGASLGTQIKLLRYSCLSAKLVITWLDFEFIHARSHLIHFALS